MAGDMRFTSNPAFSPRERSVPAKGEGGDSPIAMGGVRLTEAARTKGAQSDQGGGAPLAGGAAALDEAEAKEPSQCMKCCFRVCACMFVPLGVRALPPGQFHFHGVEKERFRFAKKNTCCMTNAHPARRLIVWLVTSTPFDRVIVFLIILNSLFLALSDFTVIDPATYEPISVGTLSRAPYTANSYSFLNHMNEISEPMFTVAFTIEMCLKIFAMGFIWEKGSYLRDGWNWLDFVVVVSGLLTSIPGIPKVSILRAVRVLRPLRSLTAIPKLRVLVNALLTAIPELTNAVAVILFMFIMFGILGLQVRTRVLVGAAAGRAPFLRTLSCSRS
jgi:hypothetical protein